MAYCDFPEKFRFGAATSSLQVEGSPLADGAGNTSWGVLAASPEKIKDGSNFDVACDFYHRYPEDIALMKKIGIDMFRFSINWARIFPDGYGKYNPRGMDFFKRLTEELLKNNITPFVTLHHWEVPQALEEKFGGWRSKETAKYFGAFAEKVGTELAGSVKNYFTVNEIGNFTDACYNTEGGYFPPAVKCDKKTERQSVHNALLGHGLAVQALRRTSTADTEIGLAENMGVLIPAIETPENIKACRKACRLANAAKLTAICEGAYPEEYLKEMGPDAPDFTEEEMRIIASPLDFLGLNIYCGQYALANADGSVNILPFPEGFPVTQMSWGRVTPEALYWGVRECSELWNAQKFYITENGCATADSVLDGKVYDTERTMFLRSYMQNMLRACGEGINIAGYFAWSFLDNFEWREGLSRRFGLVRVDYETQKRTLKLSGEFYKEVIRTRKLV